MLDRITVALGCRQAMRRGLCEPDIFYIVGQEESGARHAAHYNRRVYSAELLDHFQNPRNAGEVDAPGPPPPAWKTPLAETFWNSASDWKRRNWKGSSHR